MTELQAYKVEIFLGFREQYTDIVHTIEEVHHILQRYCDKTGLCVTITPTQYIYTKGNEPGCIIGLINYPRFYDSELSIWKKAEFIADVLMHELGQLRVTLQSANKVLMLENLLINNE